MGVVELVTVVVDGRWAMRAASGVLMELATPARWAMGAVELVTVVVDGR
jgi:hypothetical protein